MMHDCLPVCRFLCAGCFLSCNPMVSRWDKIGYIKLSSVPELWEWGRGSQPGCCPTQTAGLMFLACSRSLFLLHFWHSPSMPALQRLVIFNPARIPYSFPRPWPSLEIGIWHANGGEGDDW